MDQYTKDQLKKIAEFLADISTPIEQKLSRTQSDVAFVSMKYLLSLVTKEEKSESTRKMG
jgi:hypothetical protein